MLTKYKILHTNSVKEGTPWHKRWQRRRRQRQWKWYVKRRPQYTEILHFSFTPWKLYIFFFCSASFRFTFSHSRSLALARSLRCVRSSECFFYFAFSSLHFFLTSHELYEMRITNNIFYFIHVQIYSAPQYDAPQYSMHKSNIIFSLVFTSSCWCGIKKINAWKSIWKFRCSRESIVCVSLRMEFIE